MFDNIPTDLRGSCRRKRHNTDSGKILPHIFEIQIFRTKMNTDTQKEQAAEQAALAGGQQAGPGMPGQQPGQGEEMTDADKKLIEMYGEPEEQQGE